MKLRFMSIFLCICLAPITATAGVIQTVAGPDIASGGGVGNTLIDTDSDTDDWITTLNGGGTIYVGFDLTIDDDAGETGTGGLFCGIGLYNGNTERILLGNDWSGQNFAIARPGQNNASTIPYEVGTPARLVAKITVADGGTDDDLIELFVNQPTEGAPDASISFTVDDFTQLTHRAGNTTGQTTMGNLVVADDFASAAGSDSGASFRITEILLEPNGDITVTWESVPGRRYTIETSPDLEANWVDADDSFPPGGAIGPTTSKTLVAGTDFTAGAKRVFVRVFENPVTE